LILFGTTTTQLSQGLIQGVNSKNDQLVQKFCKDIVHGCNAKQLDERVSALATKPSLSQQDIDELELIDCQLMKIMLHVDSQCQPLTMAPWSPEVQMAYLAHRYWALQLTAKKM